MLRLGRVHHITPSRNVILRVDVPPKVGEKVVDERLKPVGTVSDIFGPVSKPYIAIKASIENPTSLVNQIVYVNPSAKTMKQRKEKRN